MRIANALLLLIISNFIFSESVLFKNASIYTGESKQMLKGHDLYVVDGKISDIGINLEVPADKVLNVDGKIITAGFIAPFTHLGLIEINQIAATRDDSSDLYSAGFSISGAFNPSSTLIPYNLNGGLTAAISAPSGSGLFSGLGSGFSLSGNSDSLLSRDIALYGSIGADGESKAANILLIEDTFELARKFNEDSSEIQEFGLPESVKYSKRDLLAIKRVLDKEIPMVVSINRASDIITMINFAKNQDIKLVIMGASEGWMVASQLAASNIPVILEPINNLPTSFDRLGSRLENAALLNDAGV